MTNEQINIAIAEACGWKWTGSGPNKDAHWRRNKNDKTFKRTHELPDYCNDLNAMHEAEKVLSYDQFDDYYIELAKRMVRPFHATAAQRAEAFIRTIGKWEEASK
jgi:hypothetical protein